MALSQVTRSLDRIHLRDNLSRGTFASIGSSIQRPRSRSRAIASSSYHQLTTSHRPLLQRRVLGLQHPVPRSELVFSVSWTRGYALKYDDDLKPITSVEDVQAIFAEVESLEKEFAGLSSRSKSTISYSVKLVCSAVRTAYFSMKDLSKSVHETLLRGKSGPKDPPSHHAKLTTNGFETAIKKTNESLESMFKLQETYAEFSGQIATLQNKLNTAKGFLQAQLVLHRNLEKETAEAAQTAAQDALDAEIKVAQLEDKLEAQRRWEEDNAWWTWASPGFAIGSSIYIERELQSGRVKLDAFRQEMQAHVERARIQASRANEWRRAATALTHIFDFLEKRKSRVSELRDNHSREIKPVLETKEALLGIQNRHLADVKALLDISFDTANVPSLCQSILRIVLAAPILPATDLNSVPLNFALRLTYKEVSSLPDRILAEAPVDEDDWRSEPVSLKELLKEVQAFVDERCA